MGQQFVVYLFYFLFFLPRPLLNLFIFHRFPLYLVEMYCVSIGWMISRYSFPFFFFLFSLKAMVSWLNGLYKGDRTEGTRNGEASYWKVSCNINMAETTTGVCPDLLHLLTRKQFSLWPIIVLFCLISSWVYFILYIQAMPPSSIFCYVYTIVQSHN